MSHSSSVLLESSALDERLAVIRRGMPDLEPAIDLFLRFEPPAPPPAVLPAGLRGLATIPTASFPHLRL